MYGVWHDGPRLQRLYDELKANDFHLRSRKRQIRVDDHRVYPRRPGRRRQCLHDCDIVNYRREILARLFFPVVHPALDYEFSKGYYARVTDRCTAGDENSSTSRS
jgi:glucosyl-3-phosphoglycerate synthase